MKGISRSLLVFMAISLVGGAPVPGYPATTAVETVGPSAGSPPSSAAANITRNSGKCLQFISVLVPAQGGNYVVRVSFAYWDLDRDGHDTPGVDKLGVCVNCADSCDWGP